MPKLYIDLETRSKADLRKVGAYVYAEDPSTQVHCVAWAVDDGPIHLWREAQDLLGFDPDSEWMELAVNPNYTLVAHNAEFEKCILRERFKLDVPVERWDDTAARAARMSLPRNLEEAAIAVGSAEQKDTEGSKVMLKLARPRRPSKENRDEFWRTATKPEDFEKLFEYCKQDVAAMREIDQKLPPLSPTELEVWRVTIRMNERGTAVDLASIPQAQEVAQKATDALVAEFKGLVGVSPTSSTAAAALGLESLRKASVRDALKQPLDARTRRALEIRALVARTSVKKLVAFRRRTSRDGRVRGGVVYAGANTLRWSGSGVQPQNFPRGMGAETDAAFEALHAGVFDLVYTDVMKAVADMLRGFFVGPFLIGDFAQIEARVLAWIAGETSLVETFRTGGDPYCEMATSIYKRKITKKEKDERFIGKTVVLGAGYGLGGAKFQRQLAEVYDVAVEETFAVQCIRSFRQRYPAIPKFWGLVERGFTTVVARGMKRVSVGPHLFMGTEQIGGVPFAWIELPSGRKMYYARASLNDEGQVRYFGRNVYKGGAWEFVSTYGGKLTENIVQALARDILALSMLELERAGFRLVMTVHDELVAEGGPERLKEFETIMTRVPPWAKGLPLGVEAFHSHRYRK